MNTSLRYLNGILTVLAVLLALQLWTSWASHSSSSNQVLAQGIPDEGAQRLQIIDQLKLLNRNSTEIKALLQSGNLRVHVTLPAEKK